jgi:hypothetical protein
VRRFFLIVAAALATAALCGAAATYDGSYYLYRLLEQGSPFVPNRRLIHAPLQALAVLAGRLDDGLLVPAAAFGLVYASMPWLALLACWWVVRRSAPRSFVWAAFGIGIATLPGQIAFISEGTIVVQLAWVLWLGILAGIRREARPILPLVALIAFFSHPSGGALLALAAGLALLMGARHPEQRRAQWTWAAVLAALAAGAAVRFATGANDYELAQLSSALYAGRFWSSVAGPPLVVLLGAATAGLALLLGPRLQARPGTERRIVSASLSVTGVVAALYAASPRLWQHALDYRFFVLPASLPFLAGAAWEALGQPSSAHPGADRRSIAERIALIFALVVVVQSASWALMSASLRSSLAGAGPGCLSQDLPELRWTKATALSHWSITPYSLLLQGRRPHAVILQGDLCATSDFAGGLPVADWEWRAWGNGWLELDALEGGLKRTAE